MINLPQGFKPLTLELMLQKFGYSLSNLLFQHMALTPETIPAFSKRVVEMEDVGLVQFALAPGDAPSCFIARAKDFTNPDDLALAEKLVSFWDLQGNFDPTTGGLGKITVDPMMPCEVQTPEGTLGVAARVAVRLLKAGLITRTDDNILHAPSKADLITWTAKQGICDFCGEDSPKNIEDVPDFDMIDGQDSVGGWASCDKCHELVARDRRDELLRRSLKSTHNLGGKMTEFAIKDLHKRFWQAWDRKHRMQVEGYGPQPHWQVALDMKANAIRELKFLEKLPPYHKFASQVSWMDLNADLEALKQSEVYSFSADTMAAIIAAGNSIPHESSLRSVELPPSKAGWFWFASPYPVKCNPLASDVTAALLWSWETRAEKPSIRFSAYVWDRERQTMVPATKWLWPVDLSFHDMLGLNHQLYKNSYGPEGLFKDQQNLQGQDDTLKVVAELSLFFMMSCLWFRQTVPGKEKKAGLLTQEDGHIERHARKRYEKEFGQTPKVRIIALRKTARAASDQSTGDGTRHLKVRFIVGLESGGFARLQPCGPGRADRKLIWIDPFVKGPEDAPFKESGDKVFAVVR